MRTLEEWIEEFFEVIGDLNDAELESLALDLEIVVDDIRQELRKRRASRVLGSSEFNQDYS